VATRSRRADVAALSLPNKAQRLFAIQAEMAT
jgi:hypothetical protein